MWFRSTGKSAIQIESIIIIIMCMKKWYTIQIYSPFYPRC